MTFVPLYLLFRFYLSLLTFFRHWYFDSFAWMTHQTLNFFEELDRKLAFKITLRYFFEPLYQERSVVGYAMGLWWRTLRLLLGLIIYSALALVVAILYLFWFSIPLYLLYQIIGAWI